MGLKCAPYTTRPTGHAEGPGRSRHRGPQRTGKVKVEVTREPSRQDTSGVEPPAAERGWARGDRHHDRLTRQAIPPGVRCRRTEERDQARAQGVIGPTLPTHNRITERAPIGKGSARPCPWRRCAQAPPAEVVTTPRRRGQVDPTTARAGVVSPGDQRHPAGGTKGLAMGDCIAGDTSRRIDEVNEGVDHAPGDCTTRAETSSRSAPWTDDASAWSPRPDLARSSPRRSPGCARPGSTSGHERGPTYRLAGGKSRWTHP